MDGLECGSIRAFSSFCGISKFTFVSVCASNVVDFCKARVPWEIFLSEVIARQICLEAVLMDMFALAIRSIPISASTCKFCINVILWKIF